MIDYILDIAFDEAAEELVQSRLFLTRSTGSVAGANLLEAYFDTAADRDAAAELLRGIDGVDMQAEDRERVDWLARYEQSLEPLLIGEYFVVAPDARLIPAGTARHALVVPQEQAFGTGSHETTSLCIELLESLDLAGKRGLDVGAGSGILALAMLRLGAAKAIAFDNDPDAYGALRDNRARNGVDAARMPLFIGGVEALRGGRFDVVTMNIIPEVILPLLGDVVRILWRTGTLACPPVTIAGDRQECLSSTGTLILSGILGDRAAVVVRACAARGLRFVRERAKGEWWAGSFTA
ncbi:MAG TPA: 50S ribosomal protein L11 methyltransferase [Thermoanaerobaculia bacterium]|nr:50S ribosomal protein L11 methyltransferase [Thermoanaerobaculia bacterium]